MDCGSQIKYKWIFISWQTTIGHFKSELKSPCSKYLFKTHFFNSTQVVDGRCWPYTFWPSDFFNSTFGIFLVTVEFIAPLLILVYCYGRIVWVLTRRIDSTIDIGYKQTEKFLLARKNTIKTFLIVSVCFVICWSNEQIYYLMYNLGYPLDWDGAYYKFAVLMAFGNCTINPFIYLIKYQD